MPRGVKPERARLRNATAIVAVRLSMSTAPRPQTSPSTSSPPNGSRCQPSAFTGTTSVWPISSSVGAVGSLPSMRATRLSRPGCAVVALEVEAGVAEVLREHVGAARLEAGLRRAVVDALRCGSAARGDRRDSFGDRRSSVSVMPGASRRAATRYMSMPPSSHRSASPACTRCSRWANVSLSAITPQCRFGNTSRESCGTDRRAERRATPRAAAPCARRGAP